MDSPLLLPRLNAPSPPELLDLLTPPTPPPSPKKKKTRKKKTLKKLVQKVIEKPIDYGYLTEQQKKEQITFIKKKTALQKFQYVFFIMVPF